MTWEWRDHPLQPPHRAKHRRPALPWGSLAWCALFLAALTVMVLLTPGGRS